MNRFKQANLWRLTATPNWVVNNSHLVVIVQALCWNLMVKLMLDCNARKRDLVRRLVDEAWGDLAPSNQPEQRGEFGQIKSVRHGFGPNFEFKLNPYI
jgi:hypothetical protein